MSASESQQFRTVPLGDTPAHQLAVDQLTAYAKRALPDDYVEFILRSNGGEGFIGEAYLVVDGPALAVGTNEAYSQFGDPLLFIGGDGGGEGLAFDLRENGGLRIVMAPLIGTDDQSCWVPVAENFSDLLAGRFTREFEAFLSDPKAKPCSR
jgi:hypothetical protein